jgi:predicted DNA-binding transcriptional regulator AlpA
MSETNIATPPAEERFLSSKQVRKMLGYSDVAAFWATVRAQGIPHVRVNSRRFIFDRVAVNAWLESRMIGGAR